MREFFFDFRSIHLRQFWATLVFMAEKPPPPRMRDKFLTPDLSIWGNFEQLWFLWQKSPLPKEGNFLTPDLSIWGNFEQLWFLWQKSPPPSSMREIFLTPDLSIWGNFEHLWFLWQKKPPPLKYEGNFFDTRTIHLRQFWATLVFVAEKPPPPMIEIFWHQSYPFQAISATLVFVAEKHPPPRMRKFFDFRSIHFRQFSATLVFVAENHPLPRWEKNFWHQIYPFEAILSNFGFYGRKAPPPDEGIIFDFRSIHFRQFWATLVFVAEPPPPPNEEKILKPDFSISDNFEQLWILWQKSPPLFSAFSWGTRFFASHRSITFRIGNFEHTLGPYWQKSPPPDEGNFLLVTRLYPLFRQYSHIQNYRTLDFGGRWKAYRQPYQDAGTNFPAITSIYLFAKAILKCH